MQVSDEVIKVLDYLCKKIGLTIDWTSNNVLPYIKQLCGKFIKWEIGTSIAWIAVAIVLIIFSVVFLKVVDLGGYEKLIFLVIVFIAGIVIGSQIFDIVTCYTFPEKAIYDYIQFQIFWRE